MIKCIDCGKETKGYGKRCASCAQKGELNSCYREGRTMKEHYYCINCGKEISRRTALYGEGRCRSCANSGKNHPNWQNGKTLLHSIIRKSIKYKRWRFEVFKRDNYTCQKCGKTDCYLETHHKKEFHILFSEFLKEYDQFSPIEDKETLVRLAIKWQPFWDIDNGKTLCKDCHNKTKKGRKTKK